MPVGLMNVAGSVTRRQIWDARSSFTTSHDDCQGLLRGHCWTCTACPNDPHKPGCSGSWLNNLSGTDL